MSPRRRATIDLEALKRLQETKEGLQRVESFPYSENLRSVMDGTVYTCRRTSPLREVLREMARRNISSAIVVDENGFPAGILTERDVMQRVVTKEPFDRDATPVAAVMTPDPVVLEPENTIYRALAVLSGQGIKHLPLVENGRVTGIVTLRQLLKLRYPEPMTMIEAIRDARGTATLKAIKDRLPRMAEERLVSGRRASDIVAMLSLINRDIHRRTLELSMAQCGTPPVSFCLYLTGSHGRLENLLTPDQDHGMVIADNDGEFQYDPYFVALTTRFSEALDRIGFALCPGRIMAGNPLWRKSVGEWRQQLTYWFERQVRELGRFVTVFFDAAPVVGDSALFRKVSEHGYALLARHHEVLRVLHEEEGGHRVPMGFLGRFITERTGRHQGELDVKRSGLLFVVEAIRILALRHAVRETGTLKRIAALVDGGFVHPGDGEYFESAYQVLLHFALESQVRRVMRREKPDTYLDPRRLSRRDREILRDAFKAVAALQELVAGEFGELVV